MGAPIGTGAVAAGFATTVDQIQAEVAGTRDRHLGISMAAIDEIKANPFQPRREFEPSALEELVQSIKENGIIQPLVVRKTPGGYELIAGERRLRAAKLSGLKNVPIVIRKSTDRESLELALIENIQRQDLNCVDEALAYFQLSEEFALTQDDIAKHVGKDRATVANHLRLLRLSETLLNDLRKGALSFGHGKALLSLEDAELRLKVRNQVIEKSLSVRETEVLVDELKKGSTSINATQAKKPPTALQSRLFAAAQTLTKYWSAKIEIKGTERCGKLLIHYGSREDLDRILEAMQNEKIWQTPST